MSAWLRKKYHKYIVTNMNNNFFLVFFPLDFSNIFKDLEKSSTSSKDEKKNKKNKKKNKNKEEGEEEEEEKGEDNKKNNEKDTSTTNTTNTTTITDPSKARYVIVIAQSAMRVCDINRALRPSPGGSIKLINKNKISYDQQMFATGRSRIAVTTTGRLQKNLNNGYLKYSQIAAIVIDSSFLDAKSQHVWDLQDTIPFTKLLLEKCKMAYKDDDDDDDSKKIPKIYLY